MSLTDRIHGDVALEYSLIDRMRVRGHIMTLQSITQLRCFFQQVRGVDWITPDDLKQITLNFVQSVEDFAQQHQIPIVPSRPGKGHVAEAAAHLDQFQQPQGVYCIIEVQEEASSFSVFINDDGPGLHHDYKKWLEEPAPFDASPDRYRHNRTSEDNADAHHKRQLMGREEVAAITGGKPDFGPWKQIFYGEFDGRRPKRVLVKVTGEDDLLTHETGRQVR